MRLRRAEDFEIKFDLLTAETNTLRKDLEQRDKAIRDFKTLNEKLTFAVSERSNKQEEWMQEKRGLLEEVEKWTAKKKLPEKNRIVVRFVVEKDGSLSHVHVESASAYCPPCNKEAIRVIQAMPAWTPGYKYDRPVRTWVRIPIIFDMRSER